MEGFEVTITSEQPCDICGQPIRPSDTVDVRFTWGADGVSRQETKHATCERRPMVTFTAGGADPDQMAWAIEHGLDPHHIARTITIDPDGLVHLRRFLLRDGKRYVNAEGEAAWEPVVVEPERPFPR